MLLICTLIRNYYIYPLTGEDSGSTVFLWVLCVVLFVFNLFHLCSVYFLLFALSCLKMLFVYHFNNSIYYLVWDPYLEELTIPAKSMFNYNFFIQLFRFVSQCSIVFVNLLFCWRRDGLRDLNFICCVNMFVTNVWLTSFDLPSFNYSSW